MKRPRVLMVGPRTSVQGGISAVERAYFDAWDHDRFELTHLATFGDMTATFIGKALIFVGALVRLVVLLSTRRPDLLHVHFSWRGSFRRKAVVTAVARAFGLDTIVLHCHAGRFPDYWQQQSERGRRHIRKALARAPLLLVVSEPSRRFFEDNHLGQRVELLSNPVRCPAAVAHDRRAQVLLFMGQLDANKGIHDLLAACDRLLVDHPAAELWVAGGGDRNAIADTVARAPWAGRVKFLGWVTGGEKDRVLRQASVFILPSYQEGMPVSMLEAMAYELPVVATTVGAIPELIEDGVHGFLFAPGDVSTLGERIDRLLTDPELAARIGRQAGALARERFDVDRVLPRLYQLYDEVLAPSASAGR